MTDLTLMPRAFTDIYGSEGVKDIQNLLTSIGADRVIWNAEQRRLIIADPGPDLNDAIRDGSYSAWRPVRLSNMRDGSAVITFEPAMSRRILHKIESAFENGVALSNALVKKVGNGVDSLDLDQITSALIDFADPEREEVCVVIFGHGKHDADRNYHYKTGRETWTANHELLQRLLLGVGSHGSLIYATCSSHYALIDQHELSHDALVIGLSDASALGQDIERWIDNLYRSWPGNTARHLIYAYLMSIENRITPKAALGGTTGVIFDDVLQDCLGTRIQDHVHDHVLTELSSPHRVAEVAKQISSSLDIWTISAKDYGLALAVSFSSLGQ